jgi:hypothetical protein
MKHIKTPNETELNKLSTKDLISLRVDDKFTKEEIRSEIASRLHSSEDEKESQDLWRRFKELN